MTRLNKTNKRTVKKSTPVAEIVRPQLEATEPKVSLITRSYRQLQAMAKERGLKASGSTADLMARLA